MKLLTAIALSALSTAAIAQGSDIGKYQIKLYGLVTTNATSINNTYNSNNRSISYVFFNQKLNPTLAVNKRTKNGNRHEVELTAFAVNETTNRTTYNNNSQSPIYMGGAVQESKFALRYEYIYVLLKDKKLQPSVGAAVSPYYAKYNFTPLTTAAYPFKEYAFGIQTFIIPRISYNISKRFFVDLNVPLKITEAQFSSRREYNPTEQNNTSHNSSFTAFQDMFYARLGIGVNI